MFTQYDQEYYIQRKEEFLHKYRCFYTVSKTISPRKIIELGTCGGSSADAYLSATPTAEYIGLDVFGEILRHDDKTLWKPFEITKRLFRARGYKKYKLIQTDLRTLDKLPEQADFVVVDAAHDAENEYGDLKLALTADPTFIFIDDANGEGKPAIEKFINEDLKGKVQYTFPIEYTGGGLVVKLKR